MVRCSEIRPFALRRPGGNRIFSAWRLFLLCLLAASLVSCGELQSGIVASPTVVPADTHPATITQTPMIVADTPTPVGTRANSSATLIPTLVAPTPTPGVLVTSTPRSAPAPAPTEIATEQPPSVPTPTSIAMRIEQPSPSVPAPTPTGIGIEQLSPSVPTPTHIAMRMEHSSPSVPRPTPIAIDTEQSSASAPRSTPSDTLLGGPLPPLQEVAILEDYRATRFYPDSIVILKDVPLNLYITRLHREHINKFTIQPFLSSTSFFPPGTLGMEQFTPN